MKQEGGNGGTNVGDDQIEICLFIVEGYLKSNKTPIVLFSYLE